MKAGKYKTKAARIAFAEQMFLAQVACEIARAGGNVSRQEIARRMGVTPARVTQILGADANPSSRTLVRMADALGTEITIHFKKKT